MADAQEKKVIELVERHYAEAERPFLLSTLGHLLRREGATLPEGMSLGAYLETLEPQLRVVRSATNPVAIAIATADNAESIQSQLDQQASVAAPTSLRHVPKTLLVAFCNDAPKDKRVFFRPTPPYHYVISDSEPEGAYVEVDEDLRMPGLYVRNLSRVDADAREKLLGNIQNWIDRHGVRLAPPRERKRSEESKGTKSALERLVESQDEELRSRILIPGDLAVLLSRS